MTPTDLLSILRTQVDISLVDGQLEIGARRSTLTPELRAEIAWHKQELIAVLEAEAASNLVIDDRAMVCEHSHVVISNGVLECRRCDLRRRVRPAEEADAPPPAGGHGAQEVLDAETYEQLVADGRDIVAPLADRGIAVRLAEDCRPWAGPTELIDEADMALLAAHRDAVLAALAAAVPEPQAADVQRPEGGADAATRFPGSNRPPKASTEHGAVHIDVPGGDPQLLDEIADVLTRHPGSGEVLLHFVVDGHEVVMQVGERFRVTAGPALQADLEACFGREVARLEMGGLGPDGVSDQAGMPGDEPEAGDRAPQQAGCAHLDTDKASGVVAADDTVSPPDVSTTATEGLVPGQEGRPAAVGAEPIGGSQPGNTGPVAAGIEPATAPVLVLSPSEVAPVPADEARVTAGDQAFAVERTLVTAAADWERVKADLLAEPVLGLDTEATGLDPFTSRLRLVQLAAPDRVYLVDAFRLDPQTLQPVLDEVPRLVGHNLKYDLRMLMSAGLQLPADIGRRLSDTMLAGQLLSAGLEGQRHRLGDLTQRYLGVELDKTEQVSDWSGDLTVEQLTYAARDAAVLLPLRDRLRAELERADLGRVALIESRALPAMAWLEQSGAPFDQATWLALAEIAEERRRGLERGLDAMAPSDSPVLPLVGAPEASSRWNSPAQVLRLLESRGVVLLDTRDETLHEHRDADPLIGVLLEHRDAAKRCGAFGREFLRFIHPSTGRVHADFFQLGSASGRVSCRAPNLQQIPHAAEYRACFRASEGQVLVGADFSQIEPRIATEISGEERLLTAYRDRRDVYRQVASELGVERSVSKTIVLGALYGLGARGLVRRLKADAGIDIAEEAARSYLDAFFAGYPALERWRSGRRGDGAVATRTLSGRRRLNVTEYTQKINTPIQGSAADVFKLAMALLYESRDVAPGAHLVLSVHDELVLEVAEAEAEDARHWLARCMREAGQAYLERVPVVVEVGVGATWADTKKTAAPVEEIDEWRHDASLLRLRPHVPQRARDLQRAAWARHATAAAGLPMPRLPGGRRLPMSLRSSGAPRRLPVLRLPDPPTGHERRSGADRRPPRDGGAGREAIGVPHPTRAARGDPMKFDCDVKTLRNALGAVVRVVPNRTSMTILGHVLLLAEKSGLTLTATDLEIGIRTSIPAEVAEAGATTVPAKLLAGVVGELNEDTVSFALKDDRLRISAGRSNTTLATTAADEFPPGPQPAGGEAITLPREELLTAIAQVKPAVSTDEARAVLTGVLMRLDGERLTLATTDGHRLVERRVDGVTSTSETAIVPVKTLGELGRAFKDEAGDVELRFAPARNQVFFRCGSSEVSSRLIDGQYPNYEQAIPKDASSLVRVARAELVRAVRMVGVVAESIGARPVSLLVDASGIRVTSQAPEVGEAEAEVEADLEGQPVSIALNSRFLLDALSALGTERVELRLGDPVTPAVIRAVDVDSCTCVVMPIRLAMPPSARARSEAA